MTGSCERPQRRRIIAAVTTRVFRFARARNEPHKRTSRRGYAQNREFRIVPECSRCDRGQAIAVQDPAGARRAAASLRQSRLVSSDSHVHVTSRMNARAATATHSVVPTKPAQLVRVPDNALHPTGRVPSTTTRDISATRTRTHACAQSRRCQSRLCAANEAVIAPSSVGYSETSHWKRAT